MSEDSSKTDDDLPISVKNRIERNRLKALTIQKTKLVSHPYASTNGTTAVSIDNKTIKIGSAKFKDTGGGFLLEEKPAETPTPEGGVITVRPPPIIIAADQPLCNKCNKPFATSWLFDNYAFKCCDECKDPEEHKLITKTDAVNAYLLKNCDLDKREPPLKYITRKNPHDSRWGDMKLYLQVQVEERALQVWGSEEKIEEERELREEKKVIAKTKKYHKQMKQLRMNMRSSLYDRTGAASHTHEFGPETYNEEDDTYTRCCTTCPYVESFEKM